MDEIQTKPDSTMPRFHTSGSTDMSARCSAKTQGHGEPTGKKLETRRSHGTEGRGKSVNRRHSTGSVDRHRTGVSAHALGPGGIANPRPFGGNSGQHSKPREDVVFFRMVDSRDPRYDCDACILLIARPDYCAIQRRLCLLQYN